MSELENTVKSPQEVQKLIEYRTAFYGKFSELSVYETNQQTQVSLKFGNPIVCHMLNGKKYMKMQNARQFTFSPGETMLVPPNISMNIEFPEATIDNPTECVCIEIENEKIDSIVSRLNENRTKTNNYSEWKFNRYCYSKLNNNEQIVSQIDKIFHIFINEDSTYRDTLIDLNISELIVRILQSNSRDLLLEDRGLSHKDFGFAAAIRTIKENPTKKFPLEELSTIACMSQATLYRHFRLEFGLSPSQYMVQTKIKKACELLQDPYRSVTDICFELGFSNIGYFIKRFRDHIGETPKKYQQHVTSSTLLHEDN